MGSKRRSKRAFWRNQCSCCHTWWYTRRHSLKGLHSQDLGHSRGMYNTRLERWSPVPIDLSGLHSYQHCHYFRTSWDAWSVYRVSWRNGGLVLQNTLSFNARGSIGVYWEAVLQCMGRISEAEKLLCARSQGWHHWNCIIKWQQIGCHSSVRQHSSLMGPAKCAVHWNHASQSSSHQSSLLTGQ